ncbi:MAG: response regulator transcription factor, partial [Deltaproteobacteria bacterium]|nr:response regulator transcription factor [Deltaproteobacteria bacterium]
TPPSHYIALFNVVFDPGDAQRALDFGIRGFFYENDSLGQITKGIRAIFADELWVSREILTKRILEERGVEEKFQKASDILTTREMEILSLVAAGIKNEEIADRLCISPHTVRTHVYNICKKINVPNRLQAALWAVKNL